MSRHLLSVVLFISISFLACSPEPHSTTTQTDPIPLTPQPNWKDSYSVNGQCYCATTYDHNIGPVIVQTPTGPQTVQQVCERIGPGPGEADNPVYNDVQCGHGPANDAGDETVCPGRVDMGRPGCTIKGPTWNLDRVYF